MGKVSNIEVLESVEELKRLQSQQVSLKAEKRIVCLLLIKAKKFKTQQLLGDYLGVGRQAIVSWLSLYRTGGIEAIQLKPTRNKPSKIITTEIHEGLEKKVKDGTNPLLGYWDAQRWVKEEFGVEITYHWLRVYMIKHFKTKLKTPRKSHIKKDTVAVATFLKPPRNAKNT